MNKALLVIDYMENACFETYQNPRFNLGLSKVREIVPSMEKLITLHRIQKIGDVVWIKSCPWIKGQVHPNIERFNNENPEAEFYSIKLGGDNIYRIQPEEHEKIFEKNMYSAFSGTQGQLDEYLREKKI